MQQSGPTPTRLPRTCPKAPPDEIYWFPCHRHEICMSCIPISSFCPLALHVLSHPPSSHLPVVHAAAEYCRHRHGQHRCNHNQNDQCRDGGDGPLDHQHHHRPERNLDIGYHHFPFVICHVCSFYPPTFR